MSEAITLKRIGVISDTHVRSGKAGLPEAVRATFDGMDLIIHAGDLVVLSVLEELEQIAPTLAVHGNMDSREVKRTLETSRVAAVEDVLIGITHGWGAPGGLAERILAGDMFPSKQIGMLVFGHSHQPMDSRVGDVRVFNPGSTTSARATVGMIEIGPEGIQSSIILI